MRHCVFPMNSLIYYAIPYFQIKFLFWLFHDVRCLISRCWYGQPVSYFLFFFLQNLL
jgi:hypothetical protein